MVNVAEILRTAVGKVAVSNSMRLPVKTTKYFYY